MNITPQVWLTMQQFIPYTQSGSNGNTGKVKISCTSTAKFVLHPAYNVKLATELTETMNDTESMNCTCDNCTLNETGNFFIFPSLPQEVRTLQATVYVIELILGTILNTSLILLIVFRKSLHQRGFATAVLILLTNIGFAVPLFSTSAHTALVGQWTLGDGFCQFIAFNNQMFQSQRWLLTAVLVIDRALTINRPLKYEKHGTRVVLILSAVALAAGFLNGIILPSILQSCIGYVPGIKTCFFRYLTSNRSCGLYLSSSTTTLVLLGGVLPFILYIWMFYKAKKVQAQIVPSTQHSTTSSRRSVSQKQILTIFIFYWTLLGCSLPYYFSFLFMFLSLIAESLSGAIAGYYSLILTQVIFHGLVIADPIALMWNKDVKQELKKIKHGVIAHLSMHFTHMLPSSMSDSANR